MSRRSAPGRKGFVWRGIQFSQLLDGARLFGSESIDLEGRPCNWRVEQHAGLSWHARLKIGGDRFPGVGKTFDEALEAAAGEASNVAAFIVALLPPASSPAARKKRPRRSRKVQR